MGERAELIARLEALTGPDREVDQLIARAFKWHPTGGEWPVYGAPDHWFSDAFGMPRYTASLDAVVDLIERARPGWHATVYSLTKNENGAVVEFTPPFVYPEPDDYPTKLWATGKTPALALCLALLRSSTEEDR